MRKLSLDRTGQPGLLSSFLPGGPEASLPCRERPTVRTVGQGADGGSMWQRHGRGLGDSPVSSLSGSSLPGQWGPAAGPDWGHLEEPGAGTGQGCSSLGVSDHHRNKELLWGPGWSWGRCVSPVPQRCFFRPWGRV